MGAFLSLLYILSTLMVVVGVVSAPDGLVPIGVVIVVQLFAAALEQSYSRR